MNTYIRLGIVGLGKIARDQHLPAIAQTQGVELVAVASRNATTENIPSYPDIDAMLKAQPSLDAIVMCQPPQPRFHAARTALLAGKHVFLEKPPGATLSEVEALKAVALEKDVTLFASWHSREAAAVQRARDLLARTQILSITICWKEDVRVWHPGQDWIWEPGGFGIFDPGINALSILTAILPEPVRIMTADLETPVNRAAPIAARLRMESASGTPIYAEFDFRQQGPQSWDISIDTANGPMTIGAGGNTLNIAGSAVDLGAEAEYPTLYRKFAELIRMGKSDVDLAPLRLVADAFLVGRNQPTEAFYD